MTVPKLRIAAKALEAYDCVKAIGINCTAPHFVASLIKEIKNNSTKPIIVYPNSGEEYDPVTKTWHGNKDGKCYCDFAAEWIAAGAKIVGRLLPYHTGKHSGSGRAGKKKINSDKPDRKWQRNGDHFSVFFCLRKH